MMTDVKFYLTHLGTETELTYSPDGWDEEMMTWERSRRYFGMFRSFSIPLRFVKDGAYILRNAFYTYGVDASVTVRICKRNKQTNVFETKYTGVIDFAGFVDTSDAVEVNIKDSGASAFIKNNAEILDTYDIPTTNIIQYNAPVANYESVKALNTGQLFVGIVGVSTFGPALYEVPLTLGQNNFRNLNNCLTFYDSTKTDPPGEYYSTYTKWAICTRACDVRITIAAGQITYRAKQVTQDITAADGITCQVRLIKRNGSTDTLITSWSGVTSTMSYGNTITLNGDAYNVDEAISLVANDEIILQVYGHSYNHEQFDFYFDIEQGAYSVQCDIYADFAPISVYGITLLQMFEAMAYRISGGTVGASSTFLTGKKILLTSGDGLRALNTPKIITSFNDFFDFLRSIDDVGFGVESIGGVDTYVIEKIDHFMDTSALAFDMGEEINNVQFEIANDFIYSSATIGPPDGKYDNAFGKDEFNQKQVWKFPVNNITSNLSLQTKYRTDCLSAGYQVKQSKLDIATGATDATKKDADEDNDVFVMCCTYVNTALGVDYYSIDRTTYEISGVSYPAFMYNAELSPRNCMMRHGYTITSMLFPAVGDSIFKSAIRNSEALTRLAGAAYFNKESDKIEITDYGNKIFIPIYMTASVPALWSRVECNTYGYVTLKHNGTTMYGFIMEVTAAIAHDQAGTIKLLLTSQNDISDLIR
jgi:hypothetical protein